MLLKAIKDQPIRRTKWAAACQVLLPNRLSYLEIHEADDENPKENKPESKLSEKNAVDRIERLFLSFKAKKRSRELFAKVKAMPEAVRPGFLKMQVTKWEQEELKHKVNKFYQKKMFANNQWSKSPRIESEHKIRIVKLSAKLYKKHNSIQDVEINIIIKQFNQIIFL